MRLTLTLLVCLLLPPPAWAQEVPLTVQGGKVVKVERTITIQVDATVIDRLPFTVAAPADAKALYFWATPPGVTANKSRNVLEVSAAPKGELKLSVEMVSPDLDKDGRFVGFKTSVGSVTVHVGEVAPPGPGPKPPDPKPDPPKPTPVGTLARALIVYETADLSKLPRAQHAVLFSKAIRDYLNAKCVLEADGKTRGWRIFDKDVDATGDTRGWAELLRRPRQSVPWLVLTDAAGAVLHEGPLPADVEQTLTLLRKWGSS